MHKVIFYSLLLCCLFSACGKKEAEPAPKTATEILTYTRWKLSKALLNNKPIDVKESYRTFDVKGNYTVTSNQDGFEPGADYGTWVLMDREDGFICRVSTELKPEGYAYYCYFMEVRSDLLKFNRYSTDQAGNPKFYILEYVPVR